MCALEAQSKIADESDISSALGRALGANDKRYALSDSVAFYNRLVADNKASLAAFKSKQDPSRVQIERWLQNDFQVIQDKIDEAKATHDELEKAPTAEVKRANIKTLQTQMSTLGEHISALKEPVGSFVASGRSLLGSVERMEAEIERIEAYLSRSSFDNVFDGAVAFASEFVSELAELATDAAKALINALLEQANINPETFWKLLDRMGGVVEALADDPGKFADTLIGGAKDGLDSFFGNFGERLQKGIFGWLFKDAGINVEDIPKEFDTIGILKFGLQVMGLTWESIKQMVAKKLGVAAPLEMVEQASVQIQEYMELGISGLVDLIQQTLSPAAIGKMILDSVVDVLVENVVQKAIASIAALILPGAGALKAVKMLYDGLVWVINNAAQLVQLVDTLLGSLEKVIAGDTKGVAAAIDGILTQLLPLAIGFAASLLSLGNLPKQVEGAIKKMKESIEKQLEKVVDWIVGKAKGLAKSGEGTQQTPEPLKEIGETIPFDVGAEHHKLWVKTQGNDATLIVESTPTPVKDALSEMGTRVKMLPASTQSEAQPLIATAQRELKEADVIADEVMQDNEQIKTGTTDASKKRKPKQASSQTPATDIRTANAKVIKEQKDLAVILQKLFGLIGEKESVSKYAGDPAPDGWEKRKLGSVKSSEVVNDDPGHHYHLLDDGEVIITTQARKNQNKKVKEAVPKVLNIDLDTPSVTVHRGLLTVVLDQNSNPEIQWETKPLMNILEQWKQEFADSGDQKITDMVNQHNDVWLVAANWFSDKTASNRESLASLLNDLQQSLSKFLNLQQLQMEKKSKEEQKAKNKKIKDEILDVGDPAARAQLESLIEKINPFPQDVNQVKQKLKEGGNILFRSPLDINHQFGQMADKEEFEPKFNEALNEARENDPGDHLYTVVSSKTERLIEQKEAIHKEEAPYRDSKEELIKQIFEKINRSNAEKALKREFNKLFQDIIAKAQGPATDQLRYLTRKGLTEDELANINKKSGEDGLNILEGCCKRNAPAREKLQRGPNITTIITALTTGKTPTAKWKAFVTHLYLKYQNQSINTDEVATKMDGWDPATHDIIASLKVDDLILHKETQWEAAVILTKTNDAIIVQGYNQKTTHTTLFLDYYGISWKLYAPPLSAHILPQEIAQYNKKEDWGPGQNGFQQAKRMLNYRVHGLGINPTHLPKGVDWHHMHENSSGGANSSFNLVLISSDLNRNELNTYYKKTSINVVVNIHPELRQKIASIDLNMTIRQFQEKHKENHALCLEIGMIILNTHGIVPLEVNTSRGRVLIDPALTSLISN
jgi:hypothetical protein